MERSDYKRPESVLVLVHTQGGEVLMMRRTRPEGFWQSVTGSLRWDETPAQAARRELLEETGIDAEPRDCGHSNRFPIFKAWRGRYPPGTQWNTEHWFELCLPQPCEVRLSAHEHTEYHWLTVAEARLLATSWSNREAIDHCLGEPGAVIKSSNFSRSLHGSDNGRSQ